MVGRADHPAPDPGEATGGPAGAVVQSQRVQCHATSGDTHRHWVVAAGVLGTFLAALDTMIVAAAMPSIIGQLGGLAIYPWVFSIYLLASTVSVPLYGKGADLFGRKPMYLLGLGLFVLGSLLCATSASMKQLILWRGLQGIGAGGVIPITYTIVGDLFPPAQRARIQGIFSAVWATSSVTGPVVGALIVEHWAWQWIFLVNLPFGVASALVMAWALRERVGGRGRRLDLGGAVLLLLGATLLMWALLQGGHAGLAQPWVWAAAGIACLVGVLFALHERRHPDPMIPPALLTEPTIGISCLTGIFVGAVLFGTSSYVPAFVQGVLQGTPRAAGAVLVPLSIGWPVATTLTGAALRRLGYRTTAIMGGTFVAAGSTGLYAVSQIGAPAPGLILAMATLGIGMGFSMTTLLIATQEAVSWQQRGAATALLQFSRTMGGALGVAALGGVLSGVMRVHLGDDTKLLKLGNALMSAEASTQAGGSTLAMVREALGHGLGSVLLGLAICGAVALAVVLRVAGPKQPFEVAERGTRAPPSTEA